VRFYGRNFLVSFCELGITKEEVIKASDSFAKGRKQSDRIEYDRSFLRKLPEGQFSTATRQWTGHAYAPETFVCERCGKRHRPFFISWTIAWR